MVAFRAMSRRLGVVARLNILMTLGHQKVFGRNRNSYGLRVPALAGNQIVRVAAGYLWRNEHMLTASAIS